MILLLTILVYLFFYLSCFNNIKSSHKYFFLFLFLLSSILIRVLIQPELNKDFDGYFYLHNFSDPEELISFIFSEPYLYLLYKFFNTFFSNKRDIFSCIYWFNFVLTNSFFVWVATRIDLKIWKKMVLFTFYYFLFGYVLLRNGPAYILFAYFFYYSFRDRNFNKIFIAPFMHLSSLALMITYFHKKKYYYKILSAIFLITIPLYFFILLPILSNLDALKNSLDKLDVYSNGSDSVGLFHKIYFIFISLVLITAITFFKKEFRNPILLSTTLIYYISFFVNPVLGFRFSPYLFMSILLFNYKGEINMAFNKILDISSFVLLPYFIFTLLDTHYINLWIF